MANTTAVHGKCLYVLVCMWGGLAKEHAGKEGYGVTVVIASLSRFHYFPFPLSLQTCSILPALCLQDSGAHSIMQATASILAIILWLAQMAPSEH